MAKPTRPLAIAVCAVAWAAGTAAAEEPNWNLTIEGGAEYDSNTHRFEVAEDDAELIEAGPLMRLGARYRGTWRPAKRQALRLGGFAGSKLFLTDAGRGEDVAILAASGQYDIGLSKRRSVLSFRGGYYDALGDGGGRTFSSGEGAVALSLVGPSAHRVTAHAGYRRFRYKADDRFDFDGDHYGVRFATTIWRGDTDTAADEDPTSVDVTAQYRFERRNYTGFAFTNGCADDDAPMPACFVPTTLSRVDLNHSAYAEVAYTGARIYSARYELQVNDSNSEGQSLVRHRVEVGVTAEPAARTLVTAKVVVQYNVFLDPLLLARDVQAQSFITIDDENRNAAIVHATRELTDEWSAEARYALYTNEFATQELSFRRHTAYVGLVFGYR